MCRKKWDDTHCYRHTHAHAHTHARTHARTHTHTPTTEVFQNEVQLVVSLEGIPQVNNEGVL